MPPWPSSRFTPSSTTPSSSSQTPPVDRQKPLPRPPQELFAGPPSPRRVPFTQNEQHISSPTRPTSSGADPRHSHNRSMSNPLPKLFSRKKSANALRLPADVPPDDALVPVMEASPSTYTPTRVISGKKNDDDRNMSIRHCMCCDNKVRFPRELRVFRCTSCLTANDLDPYRPRRKEGGGECDGKQEDYGLGNLPHQQQNSKGRLRLGNASTAVPLSFERGRAVVDRCLVTYLEARCRRQLTTPKLAPTDPFVKSEAGSAQKSCQQNETIVTSEMTDSPVELASATIKETIDFDWFPLSPAFNDSPSSTAKPSPAPLTPTPLPGTKDASSISALPPPPNRRPPLPPTHPPSLSLPLIGSSPMTTPLGPPAVPSSAVPGQASHDRAKAIFKPFEEYMLATYGEYECLNGSFSTVRPQLSTRARSESAIRTPPPEPSEGAWPSPLDSLQNMDAKTLMIGDFAENGQWWTGPGRVERNPSEKADKSRVSTRERLRLTTSRSPHINWDELTRFYELVHTAGARWRESVESLRAVDEASIQQHLRGLKNAREIDNDLAEARQHAERALLKITENLLKRPTRPLTEPDNVRFLMVILMNPSLYPNTVRSRARAASGGKPGMSRAPSQPLNPMPALRDGKLPSPQKYHTPAPVLRMPTREPETHTGIRKRILGLVAHSSDSCHRYLIGWLSRLPEARFVKIVDLVASFVTYRLLRKRSRPRASTTPQDGGLIPDLSGSAWNTSAQIRAATGLGGSAKMKEMETQSVVDYSEDWQLRAAAKVMALLFSANNSWQIKKAGLTPAETNMTSLSRPRAKTHGQLLPTSDYYNTLLDYFDLIADFKAWESKKSKFTFCQYPFFLSMGAKIKVLEYDARRQMELKAREAYFDSVTKHRAIDGYLHLRVRRDCMVDDSLQQISAAVGNGQEELKKGLKVHFTDEEGVDAGGLRKEWFLMIVRDIFEPNHGMFLYDDDSQTCYFNPNSFETSDQYYLVGALLGLAIYNSTILDVALPPFAFRKLLAAAPPSASNPSLPTAGARAQMTYTIDDLAEYRPALAAGLRQLLTFDGDVQETFCRDFVAPVERYGIVTDVSLCPGGEKKPVTNSNRQEFVDLYVRYLLDGAVARQFEPFKRGFFTVCAGNALSLFRPEEIELLVRGSDEALDVDSLRAVAVYENWRSITPPHKALSHPEDTVPVINWFWDFFRKSTPEMQRRILSFITGSDRIPAVGATNLVLRVCCGGDGTARGDEIGVNGVRTGERFPIARTCFNMLVLWGYETKEVLEEKLWRAVCESEGFGLK